MRVTGATTACPPGEAWAPSSRLPGQNPHPPSGLPGPCGNKGWGPTEEMAFPRSSRGNPCSALQPGRALRNPRGRTLPTELSQGPGSRPAWTAYTSLFAFVKYVLNPQSNCIIAFPIIIIVKSVDLT